MLKHFLESKRSTKRTISICYDAVAISIALYLSCVLRLGTTTFDIDQSTITSLLITLTVSIGFFIRLGLYRAVLRYMPHQAIATVFTGLCASSVALATSSFYLDSFIPRSVPVIYIFVGLFFIGLPRVLIRSLVSLTQDNNTLSNVIIYGAGEHGRQLSAALQQNNKYKISAFVDDNKQLQKSSIHGVRVHKPKHLPELIQKHQIEKILLAVTAKDECKKIVKRIESYGTTIETIPAVSDIISGKAKIEELRHLEIEDLLGREAVAPINTLISNNIEQKTVMITGAGGSIGSELCRQILSAKPKSIIIFELSEYNLYQIEQELQQCKEESNLNIEIHAYLGSVQQQKRLQEIMQQHKVNTVFHAAAYKHVPLIENNIIEGVRNNLFGTLHCAEAAINAGAERFILISTDKAVRPTNIMGATKRLAELVIQALAKRQNETTLSMVRFGNVLGSSGSVVPRFRKQILAGGPLTVTHPEITRYFMTIPEASQLVIQAGAMATGGEVFVLEMGKPVKISDLAKEMVLLSGLSVRDEKNLDGDIEITYTGLRPGEKLYEELLVGDNCRGTEHPRIMCADEEHLEWQEVKDLLQQMDSACKSFNQNAVKELIISSPAKYHGANTSSTTNNRETSQLTLAHSR